MSTATRRRWASVLLVLLVAGGFSACGVPADDEVHTISPRRVPRGLISPDLPPPPPMTIPVRP